LSTDTTFYSYPTNDSVFTAIALTDAVDQQLVDFQLMIADTDSVNTNGAAWYWFFLETTTPEIEFISATGLKELLVFGPFSENYSEASGDINGGLSDTLYTFQYDEESGVPVSYLIPELTDTGLYILKITSYLKKSFIEIDVSESEPYSSFMKVEGKPEGQCVECIDGDMPEAGEYLISAWVNMGNPSAGTTSYTGPKVVVTTSSGSTTITPSNSDIQKYIIDGWQLIEGSFTVPDSNAVFSISLECTTGTCYFDDVKFQPFNASMKTYVYDPFSLRLAAELDERHYATIYEYDEEGRLKRIKKETERGIMTIQESTNSNVKRTE
jgi:hypothetical protein